MYDRILIIGWPGSGKTTLAKEISRRDGLRHLCTDPQALCPLGVQGAPNKLEWSECSQYVAEEWLGMPGTVIEGVGLVRALRKWKKMHPMHACPADQVIWLTTQYEKMKPGHISMGKGHDKVLHEILSWIKPVLKIKDSSPLTLPQT